MSEWRKVKVGDFAVVARGSSPRPINDQRFFEGGKIPWIKIADATKSGKYLYETNQYVNEYGASFSRLLPRGSLIIAASGTLGYTQLLGIDGCVHDGWLYFKSIDEAQADVQFLYYLFKFNQQFFYNSAYGAAIQNVNTMILSEMEVLLPPLETQRRIAAVLSAYDDMIENNTRRIQALEQAAHDLYREWFVEFRFPGHESVEMVDSGTDYGMIPRGWGVVRLKDAIDINPRVRLNNEAEKPYISMGALSETSMLIDIKQIEYRTGNSGSKFLNEDTLLARITPSLENGKTGYVQFLPMGTVGLGSTEFIVMRSISLSAEWVYCLARMDEFRRAAEKTMTGASGRQRVQNAFFDNYKVIHPDKDLLEQFTAFVRPMFEEIQILSNKNNALREARDLLLPRLVSGQLDVGEVEVELNDGSAD